MHYPENDEYPGFYEPFIGLTKGAQIIEELDRSGKELLEFLFTIPEEKAHFKYASDKWTISQVVQHIIDTERVYNYRALRFSRKDTTELPGFDENFFAENDNTAQRSMAGLAREFETLRHSTISFFEGLSAEQWLFRGKANENTISVRAIAHIIAGHGIHHCNIIKERYL